MASLVFYKYTKFLAVSLVGAINAELGQHFLTSAQPWMPVAAPLAISFFYSLKTLKNRIGNFTFIKRLCSSVSLYNRRKHYIPP